MAVSPSNSSFLDCLKWGSWGGGRRGKKNENNKKQNKRCNTSEVHLHHQFDGTMKIVAFGRLDGQNK